MSSTKYESILVALGLTTMSTRVNQCKLNFYNKVKLFDEEFYVRRVLTEQFHGSPIPHSFSSEIKDLFTEYGTEDSYQTWLSELETLDTSIPKNQMKARSKRVLYPVDFARLYNTITISALQSSGQARLTHTATQFMNCHLGVLQVLKNPLWIPSERTLFVQTFMGCDFVTPFNHKKKPACKFCDNKKTDWPHLLFNCPNATPEENVVPCALAALDRGDEKDARIYNIIQNSQNNDETFLILMGILTNQDDFSDHIKLKNSIHKITQITAQFIAKIESRWVQPIIVPLQEDPGTPSV